MNNRRILALALLCATAANVTANDTFGTRVKNAVLNRNTLGVAAIVGLGSYVLCSGKTISASLLPAAWLTTAAASKMTLTSAATTKLAVATAPLCAALYTASTVTGFSTREQVDFNLVCSAVEFNKKAVLEAYNADGLDKALMLVKCDRPKNSNNVIRLAKKYMVICMLLKSQSTQELQAQKQSVRDELRAALVIE